MTRKDYKMIARAIRLQYNIAKMADEDAAMLRIRKIAGDMAHMFDEDNPRFDGDKFMEACAVLEE